MIDSSFKTNFCLDVLSNHNQKNIYLGIMHDELVQVNRVSVCGVYVCVHAHTCIGVCVCASANH